MVKKIGGSDGNWWLQKTELVAQEFSSAGRLHSEFIRILFLQSHRETDLFFTASGVQSAQSNIGAFFHFRHATFSSILKSRVSSILTKTAPLRVNLNLDGTPITSKSHTHPSHSPLSPFFFFFSSFAGRCLLQENYRSASWSSTAQLSIVR